MGPEAVTIFDDERGLNFVNFVNFAELCEPTSQDRRARQSAPAVAGWWASASAGGGRYVNLSTLDTSKTLSGLGGSR